MLKKTILPTLVLLIGLSTTNCDCLDCLPNDIFEVTPTYLEYPVEGATQIIKVRSSRDWTVDRTTIPHWCRFSVTSGKAGTTFIEAIAARNTRSSALVGDVLFSQETGKRKTVFLTQRGASSSIVAVAAGWDHSLALRENGTVWAWGWNGYGSLGDGTNNHSNTPVQVEGLSDIIAISSKLWHSLALKNDGTVWTWGWNPYGQLGDGTSDPDDLDKHSNIPVEVKGLNDVVAIAAGAEYSVALKRNGTVWAWGFNKRGHLGNGTYICSSTPVQVINLNNVKTITSGWGTVYALKNDETVWAWGEGRFGQIGNNTSGDGANIHTPVHILDDVAMMAAGSLMAFALKNDGTVWGWGNNEYGQVGVERALHSWTQAAPVQILSDVAMVASGAEHSFAIKKDGTVWGWGDDYDYQLGTNYPSPYWSHVPTQIPFLSGVSIKAIDAGLSHSLMLKEDRSVWAWGWNGSGRLGDGTERWSGITPVRVVGPDGEGFL